MDQIIICNVKRVASSDESTENNNPIPATLMSTERLPSFSYCFGFLANTTGYALINLIFSSCRQLFWEKKALINPLDMYQHQTTDRESFCFNTFHIALCVWSNVYNYRDYLPWGWMWQRTGCEDETLQQHRQKPQNLKFYRHPSSCFSRLPPVWNIYECRLVALIITLAASVLT